MIIYDNVFFWVGSGTGGSLKPMRNLVFNSKMLQWLGCLGGSMGYRTGDMI